MPYEPLHHKYRPQVFTDLVGQDAIVQTLINAIQQLKIAPAYLFTGPRGTGKTSTARILAKSLNCQASDRPTITPCGKCEVCKAIAVGTALDTIEIDAASNTGVDNIREIIDRSKFAPVQSRYKVYAIDECHMLSTSAFNALLKTLEEPPPSVVFILATTDPQRVLSTIISRCQRFDYRRIPLGDMVKHLQYIAKEEGIDITTEAITFVGQLANGGLRDGESLLDQLSLFSGTITLAQVWDLVGTVSEKDLLALLVAIRNKDKISILERCRNILDRGREPIVVLQSLVSFYLNLLIAKTSGDRGDLVAVTSSCWSALCEEAVYWDSDVILRGQEYLRTAEVNIKNTTQPRLWLEVSLLGLLLNSQSIALDARVNSFEDCNIVKEVKNNNSKDGYFVDKRINNASNFIGNKQNDSFNKPVEVNKNVSQNSFFKEEISIKYSEVKQDKIKGDNKDGDRGSYLEEESSKNYSEIKQDNIKGDNLVDNKDGDRGSYLEEESSKNYSEIKGDNLVDKNLVDNKNGDRGSYLEKEKIIKSSETENENSNKNNFKEENNNKLAPSEIWERAIDIIKPPSNVLIARNSHLISIDEGLAVIGVRSPTNKKLLQSKINIIEEAFHTVCQRKIKISLIVNESENFGENITPQTKTTPTIDRETEIEEKPKQQIDNLINDKNFSEENINKEFPQELPPSEEQFTNDPESLPQIDNSLDITDRSIVNPNDNIGSFDDFQRSIDIMVKNFEGEIISVEDISQDNNNSVDRSNLEDSKNISVEDISQDNNNSVDRANLEDSKNISVEDISQDNNNSVDRANLEDSKNISVEDISKDNNNSVDRANLEDSDIRSPLDLETEKKDISKISSNSIPKIKNRPDISEYRKEVGDDDEDDIPF